MLIGWRFPASQSEFAAQMLAITPELSLIFATPLLRRYVPEAAALNAGLERAILRRRQDDAGARVSNIGGWHSQGNIFDWPEPEIGRLAAEIDSGVQEIWRAPDLLGQGDSEASKPVSHEIFGWANVNQAGDYNSVHMHPGNHLSAVYYVTAGAPSADKGMDGRLELRDPRPASNFCGAPGRRNSGSLLVNPRAGMLLLFPAWLDHLVHPFQGEGHRISIAVNIAIKG